MYVRPDTTLQRLSSFLLLQGPEEESKVGNVSNGWWLSVNQEIHWNGIYWNCTDPVKQWAAVATQCGDTSEPPHTCWPPCCRLTCQGQSSMKASVPPTIRSWEPTCPQSDKQRHLVIFNHFLHCGPFQAYSFFFCLYLLIHLDPSIQTVKVSSDKFPPFWFVTQRNELPSHMQVWNM